jgi:hypothetical protein
MQVKRIKLPIILTFAALLVVGSWSVAAARPGGSQIEPARSNALAMPPLASPTSGDPDVPSNNHNPTGVQPPSGGGGSSQPQRPVLQLTARVWMTWALSRWLPR